MMGYTMHMPLGDWNQVGQLEMPLTSTLNYNPNGNKKNRF